MRNKHNITVVITGGIAAYKVPDFVRSLIKAGADVRVAMTPGAKEFVTTKTLEVLTKYPVLVEGETYPEAIGHVALADWSDIIVVMPATANTLASFANGEANNEAVSMLMASHSPLLFVPAMNHNMWHKPSTQRNIERLKLDGYTIISPDSGFLAEGYEGDGRMPAPDAILQAVWALIAINEMTDWPKTLAEKKLLISAGGTAEPLDPVRYLTNRSSGKMGIAIAHVAALLGMDVHLIRTESTLSLPVLPQIKQSVVQSAVELNQKMLAHEAEADVIIMAAAVSDYRIATPSDQKMKKTKETNGHLTLDLIENPDILAGLPKDNHYVVGFAAETQHVLEYAQDKRKRKGVNLIVANDVSQKEVGFGSDENAVYLVSETGHRLVEQQSKIKIAAAILNEVAQQLDN